MKIYPSSILIQCPAPYAYIKLPIYCCKPCLISLSSERTTPNLWYNTVPYIDNGRSVFEQIILWNKNGEANQKGRESKKSLQKGEGGHCHLLSHKWKLRWETISFVAHLHVPFNAIS